MTASTDMSTPVTRGELREEIEQLELRIDQRFERVDQRFERVDQRFERVDQRFERVDQRFERVDQRFERIDQRFEQIDQRLALLATKAELANFATKADLEAWGLALLDRMQAEIARHFRASQEWMSAHFSVVDDKYADLPGRVERLETTVYGPGGPLIRTGPRRRRRAARRSG